MDKNKTLIIINVIIIVLLLALGSYITYDKITNKCEECPKCDTKTKETNDVTYTELTNESNSKSKIGGYRIFRGYIKGEEYTIVMFYTDDKNDGFFSIEQATSMSFNNWVGGYYSIKDNTIEFMQNMNTEADKENFVIPFGMTANDLYQDPDALKEGYQIQYRLKLNYVDNKITNSNITFEEVID